LLRRPASRNDDTLSNLHPIDLNLAPKPYPLLNPNLNPNSIPYPFFSKIPDSSKGGQASQE